jgi:hypothetical protein
VRAFFRNIHEEVFEGGKAGVVRVRGEKIACFGQVRSKVVDLAVQEPRLYEGLAGVVLLGELGADPRNGQVRFEVGDPAGHGRRLDGKTVGGREQFGGVLEGMEAVVEREAVQDEFERVGAVLIDERGEFLGAPVAVIELDGLVLLLVLAFLDDFPAVSVRAGEHRFGFGQTVLLPGLFVVC